MMLHLHPKALSVAALLLWGTSTPAQTIQQFPAGIHQIMDDRVYTSAVVIDPGAVLEIAVGRTVTFEGPLTADISRHFSGSGRVVFTPSCPLEKVYPQWWGAVGDGIVECAPAIQAAIDSQRRIHFVKGNYRVSSTLLLPISEERIATTITGENMFWDSSYGKFDCNIVVNCPALFRSRQAPEGNGTYPRVCVNMRGLSLTSSPWGQATVFDELSMSASHIEYNYFEGFRHIINGVINNLTEFSYNRCLAMTGSVLIKKDSGSFQNHFSADSHIHHNYLNGYRGSNTVTLLEFNGGSTTTINNNFFDYALRGIYFRNTAREMIVANNIFDILNTGVECKDAYSIILDGNHYVRISPEEAKEFYKKDANGNHIPIPMPTVWAAVKLRAANKRIKIDGIFYKTTSSELGKVIFPTKDPQNPED